MGVHDFSIVTDGIHCAINHCFANKSQTDPPPCYGVGCSANLPLLEGDLTSRMKKKKKIFDRF